MVDKPQAADSKTTAETATPTVPPKRPPGHRSTDVRDTVAEMAARAQEISQEAGSKVAQAMKDVIGAAAGLAGFAVESARDLVQYMVRRGQMTQEEADKLLREAEEAYNRRKPAAASPPRSTASVPAPSSTADGTKPKSSPAPKKSAPAAKKASTKSAAKKSGARAKTAAARKKK
jgi:polyhydroxyalkanoate synthesis regulator phasin